MRICTIFRAAAVIAIAVMPAPGLAQHGDRPRDQGRQHQQAAPRGQARPRDQGRRADGQHAQPPRARRPPHAQPQGRPQGTRGEALPRYGHRPAPPRARAYLEPRVYGYGRPRVHVPVLIYPHPYYVFQPRYWIGFGIYLGYPVPYPYALGYPPYVYGPPLEEGQPAPDTYGGVSFDVIPDDATVSVDGAYVGIARDFSPTHQPLTLTPGRHHIEIQAPDLVPLAFDVDVVAGEVVPLRGTLQPR